MPGEPLQVRPDMVSLGPILHVTLQPLDRHPSVTDCGSAPNGNSLSEISLAHRPQYTNYRGQ
jgi:hypothetical protein